MEKKPKKTVKKDPRIELLETRIAAIEENLRLMNNRPVYIPQPPFYSQTPLHYHNGSPCWNNPCVWC